MKKILSLLFLFLCLKVSATTYYIDPSGKDTNPGTLALPFATLAKANSVFLPGDNILFNRGKQYRGVLIPASNGAINRKTEIYCMGNSITYGGYPELLQTQLGSGYLVYNRGVGGNKTADMLARFASDITANPNVDLVMIMAGTNNISGQTPVSTIKAELQQMYNLAKARGATVVALTIPPIGAVDWESASMLTALNEVNAWIRTEAVNIDFIVDVYAGMNDPTRPGSLRASDTSDGLHFTAAGYARMMTVINSSMTFTPSLSATGYITYGAYGTGAKPKIINSVDKSLTSDWTSQGSNMWKTAALGSTWGDCGNLIFNNEAVLGVKRTTLAACTSQGTFYMSETEDCVYLFSTSNPGTYYSHIEIGGTKLQECIDIYNKKYIIIQDLDCRYAGNNAIITRSGCENIIIQRCDLSFAGGMYWGTDGTRMGNGIQMWESNKDITIRENYIHDIYDAGISPQGENACTYTNINIYNNVLVNFYYGFEYWLNSNQTASGIYIYNNTFVGAGKTWSYNIRPASGRSCHLKIWSINGPMTNFIVVNNIFKDIVDHAVYTGTGRSKITSNYNLWDVAVMAQTDEGFYTTLAQWKTATGQDANSITGNPLLLADYTLSAGSPAINKGTNVGLPFNGVAPDMGAKEFVNTTPPDPVVLKHIIFNGQKVKSNGNQIKN